MPVTSVTNPLLVLLGLLSAGVVTAALTGTRLPLIGSDRTALTILLILGMSMCALGMQTTRYGWLNPFNLAGILLGVLALAVAGAVLAGVKVPYISGDRGAIIALSLIMVAKVILAAFRNMLA